MPEPLSAPFPYFGGKRRAGRIIWAALGDPAHYVEPFCGSAAVLLARPPSERKRVETIDDADGWLVNTWRAIQLAPEETARHAYGPVCEIDYHARLAWLQERRGADLVSWLEGDPEHCDPKAAGWWLTVVACGIGDPFGHGPWRIIDGHLRDTRKLPHLGDAGRGVNRELPHLGNAGRGISRITDLEAEMSRLATRLDNVRITCGDRHRVCTPAALRIGDPPKSCGLFLDPPYTTSGDLYVESADGIACDVREWCLHADHAKRIVLTGYDTEHDELLGHGWRVTQGKSGRGAGYSVRRDNGRRERLWMSPACDRLLQDTLDLGDAA